jgi:hypothetical protein
VTLELAGVIVGAVLLLVAIAVALFRNDRRVRFGVFVERERFERLRRPDRESAVRTGETQELQAENMSWWPKRARDEEASE